MSIADIPSASIEEKHLQELMDQAVIEDLHIDYKRELEIAPDEKRKEFLADVSSFANTSGGDLLIGIDAPDGVPIGIPGVELANAEATVLQVEAVTRDGLEPKLSGVQVHAIKLANQRYVLLVRVPRSWAAPHRVAYRSKSQFWARGSAGKYPLTVHDLQAAFTLSETVAERMRLFRADRIARIVANDTPVRLARQIRAVIHLVPMGAFRIGCTVDVAVCAEGNVVLKPGLGHGVSNFRFNLDGYLTRSAVRAGEYDSYCQLYRNGIIESVDSAFPSDTIPRFFENGMIRAVSGLLDAQRSLRVSPPVVCMLSLLGFKGYLMATAGWIGREAEPIDRNEVLAPEVLFESFDADIPAVLQPAIDAIWNAADWPDSPNRSVQG